MNLSLLTLFPKIFDGVFTQSIILRAQKKNLLKINIVNIRNFATNLHKTVDDKPYGGGRGMVLKVDVTIKALESIKPKPYSILLAANGKKFDQKKAKTLSKKRDLALICGHYEGVDARVEKFVDDTLSIGDFVLTGGEIAAMAIVDCIVRLLPKAIHESSVSDDSFSSNGSGFKTTLEYPQYTRPAEFRTQKVPKILLGGNHQQIKKWRKEQSLKRTKKFRPDLLK